MKKLLLIVLVACLTACLTACATPGGIAAIDDAIGVAPGENAILCIEGDYLSPLGRARGRYRRIEMPSTMVGPPTQEQVNIACPRLQ